MPMTPEVKNELKRQKKKRKIRRRAPRPEGEEEDAGEGGADDERERDDVNGRDVDGAEYIRDDYFDGANQQKKGVLGWIKGWFPGGGK